MDRGASPSSGSRFTLSSGLTKRSQGSDSSENSKGALGLQSLYIPPWDSANADLIFVHGLGGGSRSTWIRSGNPLLYWPKEWLPQDDAFQDVRIHSFGYDSNWSKESVLGIHDFANALLNSIRDCPEIPWNSTDPIVLIGHSMGGLVIKRAFLLAKGVQEFKSIASRIQAMFFLATPHRGADLAQTLSKLLSISGSTRPFVSDLQRNSLAVQSINEEFPQHCQNLKLYSFYETIPTNLGGIKRSMVVEKDFAVMGYANEQRGYLQANHREVCKYTSPDDPNYRTVRNALASVLNTLLDQVLSERQEIDYEQKRLLQATLGVTDTPEDDFLSAEGLRMSGSCQWLINKETFRNWLRRNVPPIYCLTAKPATGKTVISGKVISHLREQQKLCSFYFFKHGNKEKCAVRSFLLSLAWQMALLDEKVLGICLDLQRNGDQLKKADHRAIWRILFLEGILKVSFEQTHFWVVDALDECIDEKELVSLLIKITTLSSVRVFLTSRNEFESHEILDHSKTQVHAEHIMEDDSKNDIALYLEANMNSLPSISREGRQYIVQQVIDKSRGCFLWVNLVFQELKDAHTSTDVQKILDEVPVDMNDLYARILGSMSARSHGKRLGKAILIWTVCAIRPLRTFELHEALQLDLQDSVDDIEASIRSCCGQLVYIDIYSQVQMIHLTARQFLLHISKDSEFAVDQVQGHHRLLLTCLKYLNGDAMKVSRRQNTGVSKATKPQSALVRYISDSLPEHIEHLKWTDREALSGLATLFRSSNILSWIKFTAMHSDLHRLIQTGGALTIFLEGTLGQDASLDGDVSSQQDRTLLDSWKTDLVRVVMKFGNALESYPSSILHLIAPFCPLDTALRKQFGSSARNIAIKGLRARTWDNCLSTIVNDQEQYSCVASSKVLFAIGSNQGQVSVFEHLTCQEIAFLDHREPVRSLSFGEKKSLLVTAGYRIIRVWDLSSNEALWEFTTPMQCMALRFSEQDQRLIGAMKDHRLKIWNLDNGLLIDNIDWTRDSNDTTVQMYRRPITAAFSQDADIVAIIYKGQDVLLWDLDSHSLHDIYSRESGAFGESTIPYGSAGVRCLVFGNAMNSHLLACEYGDGELILFDTSTGKSRRGFSPLHIF